MPTRTIMVDTWNGAEVSLTRTGKPQVRPETGDAKFQQLMALADTIRLRRKNPVAYEVLNGVDVPFAPASPEPKDVNFMHIYLEKPRGRPDHSCVLGVRLTVNAPAA